MNLDNFPQNNLPKELLDIPFGQIYILTNPFLGITLLNTRDMQFIFSVARQLGKSSLVNAMPIEYSQFWNCFACKVKTEDGAKVLISNQYTLVEMLCEFWSLDSDEVANTIYIGTRYKNVSSTAHHPLSVSAEPAVTSSSFGSSGSSAPALGAIQTYTRDKALEDIKITMLDNFNYGLGISLEDIIDLYKILEKDRKTYSLDIQIEKKDAIEKGKHIQKIKKCEIILIDNEGEKYPLHINVYCVALYLTFYLFKDGINLWEVTYNDEFKKTFSHIYYQLPYSSRSTKPSFNLGNDREYQYFTQKIGVIRDAIMDITHDNYTRELFAVEGVKEEPFGIAGATEELRLLVKKEFNIK